MKKILVLALLLSSKIAFADHTYMLINHLETPVVLKGENGVHSQYFYGRGQGQSFSTDELSKLCTINPSNCNVEVIGDGVIGKVIFDLNTGIKQGYSLSTRYAILIKKYSGPSGWDQIDVEPLNK